MVVVVEIKGSIKRGNNWIANKSPSDWPTIRSAVNEQF